MDSSNNEWELSKENVQPRKEGRNIASLIAGLTPRPCQEQMKKEKQDFEMQLRVYDGPDPLDVWYKYISWTEEHVPKGGKDVFNLLERCIVQFNDASIFKQYKQDHRYLNLWVKYANFTTDPTEVYNYLHSQGIGTQLAYFYESWAYSLESLGKTKQADEVFTLGINRKAEPLERLKRHHKEFEARLVKKIQEGSPETGQENRTSLAPLKKRSKGGVSNNRVAGKSASEGGIGVLQPQGQLGGVGFKIFDDSEKSTSSVPAATGEWQKAPLSNKITKENTQKATQWTRCKIPGMKPPPTRQTQPFSIHVDTEMNPVETPRQLVMQERKPLSAKKIEKVNKRPEAILPYIPSNNPNDKPRYCKDLVYMGNQEFSFEEIHAHVWFQKYGPLPSYDDDVTKLQVTGMEVDETLMFEHALKKVRTRSRSILQGDHDGALFENQLQQIDKSSVGRHLDFSQDQILTEASPQEDDNGESLEDLSKHWVITPPHAVRPKVTKPVSVSADENSSSNASVFKQIQESSQNSSKDNNSNYFQSVSQKCSNTAQNSFDSQGDKSACPNSVNSAFSLVHQGNERKPMFQIYSDEESKEKAPSSVPSRLKQNVESSMQIGGRSPGPVSLTGKNPSSFQDFVATAHSQRDVQRNSMANSSSTNIVSQENKSASKVAFDSENESEHMAAVNDKQFRARLDSSADKTAIGNGKSAFGSLLDFEGQFQTFSDQKHSQENKSVFGSHINFENHVETFNDQELLPQITPNERSARPKEAPVVRNRNSGFSRTIDFENHFQIFNDQENFMENTRKHVDIKSKGIATTTNEKSAFAPPVAFQNQFQIFEDHKDAPKEKSDGVFAKPQALFSHDQPLSSEKQFKDPKKDQPQTVSAQVQSSTHVSTVGFDKATPSKGINNRSGLDSPFNPIWAPSPTVHTKEAMLEVCAMFNKTLDSEKDEFFSFSAFGRKPSQGDFENQFKDGNQSGGSGGLFSGGMQFAIYDDSKSNSHETNQLFDNSAQDDCLPQQQEDKENTPPLDYTQEKSERENVKVLQPSGGIPFVPLAIQNEEKEKETSKIYEQTLPPDEDEDFSDRTFVPSGFSAAAALASTPFTGGAKPPPLYLTAIADPCAEVTEEILPTKNQCQDDKNRSDAQAKVSPFQAASYYGNILSPIEEGSEGSSSDHACSVTLKSQLGSTAGGEGASQLSKSRSDASRMDLKNGQSLNISRDLESKDGEVQPHDKFQERFLTLSLHEEPERKSINPFETNFINQVVRSISLAHYYNYTESQDNTPKITPHLAVGLGSNVYRVLKEAGKGGFSKVYEAIKLDADMDVDMDEDNYAHYALKKMKLPVLAKLEFYMVNRVHERIDKLQLPSESHESVIKVNQAYVFADAGVIENPFYNDGTLLDLVNIYRQENEELHESLALLFCLDIIRTVEMLHNCGIIHGDIKPDNFLLIERQTSEVKDPLRIRCLTLTDFGRAIDLKLLPPGTDFIGSCNTDAFECIEMKEKKPWKYQVDYYGVACTIHVLIFQQYMNVYRNVTDGRWQQTKLPKRRWDQQFWNNLFDKLLNIPGNEEHSCLTDLRKQIEVKLQDPGILEPLEEAWKREEVLVYKSH